MRRAAPQQPYSPHGSVESRRLGSDQATRASPGGCCHHQRGGTLPQGQSGPFCLSLSPSLPLCVSAFISPAMSVPLSPWASVSLSLTLLHSLCSPPSRRGMPQQEALARCSPRGPRSCPSSTEPTRRGALEEAHKGFSRKVAGGWGNPPVQGTAGAEGRMDRREGTGDLTPAAPEQRGSEGVGKPSAKQR